jgi:hypothetical protein
MRRVILAAVKAGSSRPATARPVPAPSGHGPSLGQLERPQDPQYDPPESRQRREIEQEQDKHPNRSSVVCSPTLGSSNSTLCAIAHSLSVVPFSTSASAWSGMMRSIWIGRMRAEHCVSKHCPVSDAEATCLFGKQPPHLNGPPCGVAAGRAHASRFKGLADLDQRRYSRTAEYQR